MLGPLVMLGACGGGGPLLPSQLGSVWEWWDPTDESSITVDGSLTTRLATWTGQIEARNLNRTVVASRGPETGTVDRNGLNVLHFNASNSWLEGPEVTIGTDDIAMFIAMNTETSSAMYWIGTFTTGSNPGGAAIYRTGGSVTTLQVDETGPAQDVVIVETYGPRPWETLWFHWDRNAGTSFNSGVTNLGSQAGSDATDYGVARPIRIGRFIGNSEAGFYLRGHVGDIVILKAPSIPQEDIDAVIAFMSRWD